MNALVAEAQRRGLIPVLEGVDPIELDAVSRTIYGEARGEGEPGMQAVANVILNRAKLANARPLDVVKAPKQFSTWNDGNVPGRDAMTDAIALRALRHELGDITGGADHYLRTDIIPNTDWAYRNPDKQTKSVGAHSFFRLGGSPAQFAGRVGRAALDLIVPPASADATLSGQPMDQRLQWMQDAAQPGTVGTAGNVQTSAAPMGTGDPLIQEAVRRGLIDQASLMTTPDTSTGGSFHDRLRASFKTPAGKLAFLQAQYGAGNVAVRPDGNVFFRKSGRWIQFDPASMDLGDIADFAGDLPATAGAVFGAGISGGNPLAAGAGAALGNAAKQALAELVPGEAPRPWPERIAEAGGNFVAGAASQWLTNKAVGMFDRLRPRNLAARQVIKSLDTPYAREGAQLSERTGVPLSLGQQTGNRLQLGMEGLARRNFVTADEFKAFGDTQLNAAVSKLDDIMAGIHPREVGSIGYGSAVSNAFDDALNKAVTLRRTQAAKDFGLVNDRVGARPLIRTDHFRATLEDVVRQHSGPGMPPASQKIAAEAKRILDGLGLVKEGVKGANKFRATAQRVQKWLQAWGDAAEGSGRVFVDLDTASERRIASQIRSAILRDLDDTAKETGLGRDVAQSLLQARKNYATLSQGIENLKQSVIGRYLGSDIARAPERVADLVMRMKPTELHQTMKLLGRHDPDLVAKTRRYVLEQAMEKSLPGHQGGQFSAAKFLNGLPKGDEQFNLLFGTSTSRGDLEAVTKVLQRIVDKGGTEGSPTAPLMMAWDLAKGVFTLNPRAIAGIPTAVLAPKAIARAALTPQGRSALITLSQTGAPAREVAQAAAMLVALSAAGRDPDAADAAATNTRVWNR